MTLPAYVRRGAWIAGVLFVLLVMARWDSRAYPHDFFELWAASEGVGMPEISNVYASAPALDREMKRRFSADTSTPRGRFGHADDIHGFNITFTPLLIAWTKATSVGDLKTDWNRYRMSAMLGFGLGFLFLAWAMNVPVLIALPCLYVFSRKSWAFWLGLQVGNFAILQAGLLMIALALLRWRRPDTFGACGFVLGFIAIAKPTLAFTVPFLFLSLDFDRRWTDALAVAAGFAVAAVAGLALGWYEVGSRASWLVWAGSVPGSLEHMSDVRSWTFISEVTGSNSLLLNQVFRPVVLAGAAVWFWVSRRRHAPVVHPAARDAGAAAVGSLLYLLAGPLVHTHYFLQALPAGLIALRAPRRGRPLPALRWALALAGCFLLGGHRTFARWGWTTRTNFSALTYLGVCLLLALLLADRTRDGLAQAEPS